LFNIVPGTILVFILNQSKFFLPSVLKLRIALLRHGASFDCNKIAVHREAEMVCAVCNGKGYVVEKQREAVCSECHGRGEYFLNDRNGDHEQKAQQVHDAT
jgi:RecJ-like exonuclease